MAETSAVLTDDAIRRQVLLEGVKEDIHKKFLPFLRRIDRGVRDRLLDEGDAIETRKRLNALLSDVTRLQREIYEDYTNQLLLDLDDVAITQSVLEVGALDNTVDDFEAVKPSAEQLLIAYKNNPLSIEGKGQGLTLKPFLKDFTETQITLVNGMISQGFAQGQTISQITRNIRGLRGNRFADGELARINRNDRAMVRTAVQNAGEQARQRTWDSNKDLIRGVEWVSTLDSRTTTQCRSLDGREFPVDKGPRPPIHYGCRSTITPVLSERFDFLDKGGKRPANGEDGPTQVNQDTTYYSWLKRQPASFQDDVLGPTRGKLLRNGGLTSEEFAALNLNTNFRPRTIEEMRREAPEAFADANL